jgi:hypothetical protein
LQLSQTNSNSKQKQTNNNGNGNPRKPKPQIRRRRNKIAELIFARVSLGVSTQKSQREKKALIPRSLKRTWNDPPSKGCARSQLLNIFTSADRFVFIIYHRSCSFSLRYAYPYCNPHPSFPLLPRTVSAVRVVEFPVLINPWPVFFLVWTVAIAITLSLFEIGTYSYAIGERVSPFRTRTRRLTTVLRQGCVMISRSYFLIDTYI